MKTDEIKLTQEPEKLTNTLDKVELIALYADMTRRDATSMRLLTEELLSATSGIWEASDGTLWMETSPEAFRLHLRMQKPTDVAAREKLIALSKSGEASLPKGLFRRLGRVLSNLLLGDENDPIMVGVADYLLPEGSMSSMATGCTYHYLPCYARVAPAPTQEPADELAGIEKRIIDAIVDDVLVTPYGDHVEITAVKNLNK